MKLSLKFTMVFIVGMCIILAIQAWVNVRRETAFYEADARHDQHIIASALGLAFKNVWTRSGEGAAIDFLRQTNRYQHPKGVTARWLPPSLSQVGPLTIPATEFARLRKGQEVMWTDRESESPGRVYTALPVTIPAVGMGAIEVDESLADEQRYVNAIIIRSIITAAGIAAVCSVLALVLGMWLVGRRIDTQIAWARQIARGNLGERLNVNHHDELSELAVELNRMGEELGAARERVATETAARIHTIEQLRHADRLATVGKLASGVAHELGTPLNVVWARARMVAGDAQAGERAAGNARIISQQAERMTAIIRQLLDFARPRSPARSLCDLAQVARQTTLLLTPMADKRSIKIELRGCDAPVPAEVDADQIQQVLSNLVMNGLQAMSTPGTLRVDVRAERAEPPADHGGSADEYLCLCVEDHGQGIAPEHLPHLFEPFFTTKDVGEGTGLGLSISRGIVQEHGGWIAVRSEPGKGSRFSVYLPRKVSECPAAC